LPKSAKLVQWISVLGIPTVDTIGFPPGSDWARDRGEGCSGIAAQWKDLRIRLRTNVSAEQTERCCAAKTTIEELAVEIDARTMHVEFATVYPCGCVEQYRCQYHKEWGALYAASQSRKEADVIFPGTLFIPGLPLPPGPKNIDDLRTDLAILQPRLVLERDPSDDGYCIVIAEPGTPSLRVDVVRPMSGPPSKRQSEGLIGLLCGLWTERFAIKWE
jgi:hypothetical protein